MKRRTKIVCTLGPAVDSLAKLEALLDAGMNVARLNCSHGTWDTKRQWLEWLRGTWTEYPPVGILADLQGPKIRIGNLPDGQIDLKNGKVITISQAGDTTMTIPTAEIFNGLAVNDRVLMGDGNVELKISASKGDIFEARVVAGGIVKSKQGVTVLGRSFAVPSLTEKDKEDVREACEAGADFIALSYVREASDMRELRRCVDQYDPSIRLCAKIETREGLKNIDEIIKVSDLIMVARGDLGLQMDIEDVPIAQKVIIERCLNAGTPVITATQMLESMIVSPRPTRAEATDIANAVLDGTDALMLSGETAAGEYPIEAVKMMARIAEKAENKFDNLRHFDECTVFSAVKELKHTEAVAEAAVQLANSLKVKAIVCTSTSGMTPQLVAKFRPKCPIYCATWTQKIQEQLSVTWGVESFHIELSADTDETVHRALDACLRTKRLKVGDQVVITAGVPTGSAGNTNLIQIETIK